jgi:outer membrane receptor protein involved in Fe transport
VRASAFRDSRSRAPLAGLALLLLASSARAQDVALPELGADDGKKPASSGALHPDDVAIETNSDIDLANVVISAAKAVTTVQEATSIVTVITGDDIKRRGLRTITQALDGVPGWMSTAIWGTAIDMPLVRGVQQAALQLHDGISMFDPWFNFPSFNRSQSLETLKRIEVVTGPGGVLWGANSFLGIVNLISKDAEDVNGLEVSAGYGDGPGNRQDIRAYAMFGRTFFGGKLKIFQHVSYENYIGPVWTLPKVLTPWTFGPNITPPLRRSYLAIIDGKYSFGPFSLYYSVPFGQMSQELSFMTSPDWWGGWNVYDRHAILEYKQRFFRDRLSVSAKGYYTQFVREIHTRVFPDSAALPAFTDSSGNYNDGGFQMVAGGLDQRYGANADADLNLPYRIRALGGVEAFAESVTSTFVRMPSLNPGYFGYLCPLNNDGSQVSQCPTAPTPDSSRTVVASYVDLQWRPVHSLTLEGGVRVQQGFGHRPYALTPLYSAAAVWSFWPDLHLKVNYATGFRAPVFNNTDGFLLAGNPHLLNERSQSFQGELNARVLRNRGLSREVELRLDYSYTVLNDLIEATSGFGRVVYNNSSARNIHSVEGLARFFIVGEHFVEIGYTYLSGVSQTYGYVRTVPTQWVSLNGSLSVIRRVFDLNAGMIVYASFEDPNRYASGPGGLPGSTSAAPASAVTWDHVSPVGVLQLGARVRLMHQRLDISAQFYNALNQQYSLPDATNGIRPNESSVPLPAAGFNFFSSISYRFL